MPMWISITVGAGSLLGLFAVTGFALARVLGMVSREISEIYANDFVDDPAADSYPLAKREQLQPDELLRQGLLRSSRDEGAEPRYP
jgi:hypothetical protein